MSIGNQLAVIRRDIELFGREPNDAGKIISLISFGLPVCAVHLAAQNLRHARSGDAKPIADLGERVTLPPHCCHLLASLAGVFRCKPV